MSTTSSCDNTSLLYLYSVPALGQCIEILPHNSRFLADRLHDAMADGAKL